MPSNHSARLEHVGIAANDIDGILAVLAALLGEEAYLTESVAHDGLRTHFVSGGTAKLELLEALNASSPAARFLERRGPGLHHLAFEVDDVDVMHERARKAGFEPLDDTPRPGTDGKRIFFLHPKQTGGVLLEFCESVQPTLRPVDGLEIDGVRSLARSAGSASRRPLVFVVDEFDLARSVAERLAPDRIVWAVASDGAPEPRDLFAGLGLDTAHVVTNGTMAPPFVKTNARSYVHSLLLLEPDPRMLEQMDTSNILVLLRSDDAGLRLAADLRMKNANIDIIAASSDLARVDVIAGHIGRLD